ncbi:MAG: hypothetical protein RIM99_12750 [Cyclobacteriaceae bacterium]
MIKFVVLLTSAITLNFTMSFGEILGISGVEKPQEIQLIFSETPIAFESGQPVYPINTEVYLKCEKEKNFTISVNGGKEIKKNGSRVDISSLINTHADTYTVLVEAEDGKSKSQKIFGFTIR